MFTKLDLSQAYQQVELEEASKAYVVINTHRGLFQYNRLPYGIASAPGSGEPAERYSGSCGIRHTGDRQDKRGAPRSARGGPNEIGKGWTTPAEQEMPLHDVSRELLRPSDRRTRSASTGRQVTSSQGCT